MKIGLDRLPHLPGVLSRLKSARFGVLAHPASVNAGLVHIAHVLSQLSLKPALLFGPEHGYGGEAQDMIGVPEAVDALSGAPIKSLYGDRFEDLTPRSSDIASLDLLLIDLADVGSRYYTFVWTALLALRAASKRGVHTLLLDRPNPLSGDLLSAEGATQRPGFLSFVGLEPLPIRHALTVGEILAYFAKKDGISLGPNGAFSILPLQDWDRNSLAHHWSDQSFVMTSPNMPTADTALVYPGGCLIEGTNLSEGRGTTRPFELIGASWLDGERLARELNSLGFEGFYARPLTFRPTFHKHGGQICGGVQIHVQNPKIFRPVAVYTALTALAHHHHPEHFRFRIERYEYVDDIPAFDLLTGSGDARLAIEEGAPAKDIAMTLSKPDAGWPQAHAEAQGLARTAQWVQ